MYCDQHSGGAEYLIQICKNVGPLSLSEYPNLRAENPYLLRGRIHSRFSNQTRYYFYIFFDTEKSGIEMIQEFCCQCKNGLQTNSCYANIMNAFWYLGYARWLPEIPPPAQHLNNFFLN